MKGFGRNHQIIDTYCVPMGVSMRMRRAIRINVNGTNAPSLKRTQERRAERATFLGQDDVWLKYIDSSKDLVLKLTPIPGVKKSVHGA